MKFLPAIALTTIVSCTATNVMAQQGAANVTGLPSLAEMMADDAELVDVFFIDSRRGWAVGDRGVIWHTTDGGRQWRRQTSGVTCPLSSVWFISPTHGWAVGGATQAYIHATAGVVLHTTDGGQTWNSIPAPMLPALSRVKFFTPQQGIAIGKGTVFYPSGVFATRDGGRSWQGASAQDVDAWLAGDFIDPDQGALAGARGKFASVVRREVRPSPLATSDRRALHALRLASPTGGWLVGDGGIVRTTRDLGHSWQLPAGELPAEVAQHFDWRTLAVVDSHVWIAGTPGTVVLHSPDNGATWELQSTGQTLPLRGLAFSDAQHGWAVGALGTILVTQDGGRSWQLQRTGGRRAALWIALARPERTPSELIAKHAAAEGYLTAVTYLFAAGEDASDTAALESARAREGVVGCGGSSADVAWQLPLPHDAATLSTNALQAVLDHRTDSQALTQLEARLVRNLRMWRPDVVLLEHPAATGGDPAVALLQSVMEHALAAADDATKYPELIEAGLAAWQPKRVCCVEPEGQSGSLRISTGEFTATLGSSLSQYVASSAGLLSHEYAPPRSHYDVSVLRSAPLGAGLRRDLFDGLVLSRGGEARRPAAAPAVGELDTLRRLAQQRRQMQELLKRTSGDEAWTGQVVNLTGGLDAASGGELLFQLAEGYREAGRLDMAADTYYLLARRYADHPLVPRAIMWLVQFYASGEQAHQATTRAPENIRVPTNLANVESSVNRDVRPSSQDSSAERSALADLNSNSDVKNLTADARWERASLLAQYLEQARPAMYAEPNLRFPLAAAHRSLGYAKQADQYYVIAGKQAIAAGWRECADAERWLREPDRLPPTKSIAACRTTAERPHLDGLLDEPLWQQAELIKIAADSEPTTLRLLRDDEFLYLAVTCAKRPGVDYAVDESPRPRDGDIVSHDRITLHLDIDRDYTTAYDLTVDHRGWTNDRLWGDIHWNPLWFVAAHQADNEWTIEAAVPIRELAEAPISPRSVWAIGVERVVPGEGVQSWSGQDAPPDSPERFGLLLFE